MQISSTDEYALAVVAGEIVTGRLVRLACERHLRDREHGDRRGLRFDEQRAEQAIRFFELGHHYKGRWARPPKGVARCTCKSSKDSCPTRLSLEPWQRFFVGSIFGWVRFDEQGREVRRFRVAYQQVGRKNAKTFLSAMIALKLLIADGERGPEIYSGATKKDQARLVWNDAKQIAKLSPQLRGKVAGWDERWTNLYSKTNPGSKFEPVGRDSETQDGFSPHGIIIDEYHAHKTNDIRDVLRTGIGAREQPLEVIITTAGQPFKGSPCRAEREYAEKVLEGLVEDDEYFTLVYELDEGDDWTDETVWIKANPNLGVSVDFDNLRAEAKRAQENPILQTAFRMKRLNEWLGAAEGYINMDAWVKAPPLPDDLLGRRCYGGLDLAATEDLTAFALLFPPDEPTGIWAVKVWHWIPSAMRERRLRRDRAIIQWAEQGWVRVTEGNETDYQAIRNLINEKAEQYEIEDIGYDPWNAYQLAHELTDDGLPLTKVRQGVLSLSAPTKKLSALIAGRRFAHGDNPLLSWEVSNVTVRSDANENVAPDKSKSADKIDGFVASVIAMNRALEARERAASIYEAGTRASGQSVYE